MSTDSYQQPPGLKPQDSAFSDRADRYDLMINWERRLANEERFYRTLFESSDVNRVLDVACGTGHHAAMFNGWGLDVEGADVSSAMLDRCRQNFGESDTLRWAERSFDQSTSEPGTFDAVICVGNSLALAQEADSLDRTMAAMLSALRSGGVCVVQVLNLWSLASGVTTWQKCKRVSHEGADLILLKAIHRVDRQGFVDLVELTLNGADVRPHFSEAVFEGIEPSHLSRAVYAAGGIDVELFGSFEREPYHPETSQDLILTCRHA